MEHSSNGDPRGDIIARGIVSEEQARMMYERYAAPIWNTDQAWRTLTKFQIHRGKQEFLASIRSYSRHIRLNTITVPVLFYSHNLPGEPSSGRLAQ